MDPQRHHRPIHSLSDVQRSLVDRRPTRGDAMTNIDDIFGHFPGRPSHSDFWKLSSIILRHDGKASEENGAVPAIAAEVPIDLDALIYMATQRALRMGLGPNGAAIWIDAFLAGAAFGKEALDKSEDL